jgi:hypothetical protein
MPLHKCSDLQPPTSSAFKKSIAHWRISSGGLSRAIRIRSGDVGLRRVQQVESHQVLFEFLVKRYVGEREVTAIISESHEEA